LAAALAAPILAWIWATPQIVEFTLAMTALIGLRHATNIRRLLRGAEPRIGAGH
jgi:glycerol-3-phosphate acyltransferase PlsY